MAQTVQHRYMERWVKPITFVIHLAIMDCNCASFVDPRNCLCVIPMEVEYFEDFWMDVDPPDEDVCWMDADPPPDDDICMETD